MCIAEQVRDDKLDEVTFRRGGCQFQRRHILHSFLQNERSVLLSHSSCCVSVLEVLVMVSNISTVIELVLYSCTVQCYAVPRLLIASVLLL